MQANKQVVFFNIEHDTVVKVGLKDKKRLKSFLKFGLDPKKN